MKLKYFIRQLKNIEKEHSGFMEVKMADYMPVVAPLVGPDECAGRCIIITDQNNRG